MSEACEGVSKHIKYNMQHVHYSSDQDGVIHLSLQDSKDEKDGIFIITPVNVS